MVITIGNLPHGFVVPAGYVAITYRPNPKSKDKRWGINVLEAAKTAKWAGTSIVKEIMLLELHEMSHVCEVGMSLHVYGDPGALKSVCEWNVLLSKVIRARKLKSAYEYVLNYIRRFTLLREGTPYDFTHQDIVLQDAKKKGWL